MSWRISPSTLRRALLRPAPLIALLVLLAALAFYLDSLRGRGPEPVVVEISQPQPPETVATEVRLVRYDANGLAAPTFVRIEMPQAPAARLEAILNALKEEMLGAGWNQTLPVPTVFVEEVGRQLVAVLDFRPPQPVALSISEERRLLRSIEETVLGTGVDAVRFLLGGEARGVFLEHLVVPTGP